MEGDGGSEGFELGDEAAANSLRVTAGVVVGAGVGVDLAGWSMCQAATSIECATVVAALLASRRMRSRWCWAAR